MGEKAKQLILLPLFPDQERVLKFLAEHLRDCFQFNVKIAPWQVIPPSAYYSDRRQYHAEWVLRSFLPFRSDRQALLLIIADDDLFVPDLNFVFGVADQRNGACIISLTRLRQEFYGLKPDEKLFLQRALKEAVHELGHVLGLSHCSNRMCVMHFSNSLGDTDYKSWEFCPTCKARLKLELK